MSKIVESLYTREKGHFNIQLTGAFTSTRTIEYLKDGNHVTLIFPTTFAISTAEKQLVSREAIPIDLRPKGSVDLPIRVSDMGLASRYPGNISVNGFGDIEIMKDCYGTPFSLGLGLGAACGFAGFSINYFIESK